MEGIMRNRNALLGTTALVAGGMAAGPALADGVELGIGGRYAAAAGVNVSEDFYDGTGMDDPRAGAFKQDVEIHFTGETTLDNGITVGAAIRLEGQQSGDQIDEVWAYFNGSFGEIRFGDDEDASEQLAYGIPTATNIFGVDSPYFSFSNAWAAGLGIGTGFTYNKLSDNATKLIYFSPSFGGFTFALSYAPDRRGEDCHFGFTSICGNVSPGGTTFANNGTQISEVWSAAMNFEHDFNSFTLITGIGGSHGEFETPGFVTDGVTTTFGDDDIWAVRGHLQAAIGNWYVGGSMVYRTNFFYTGATPALGDEVDVWFGGLGITYNWDAWTAGFSWAHGMAENWGGAGNDATLDIFRLEGRYDLGPGISLDASVGWDSWDADAQADYSAWSIMTGFYIGF
jgi:hypothetical protein